jgi:hypothetical protein
MTMANTALAATGNIRYNFFITTFSAAFALGGAAIGAHFWGLRGVTAVFVIVLTVESVGFLVITMRILGGKVSSIAHQVWRPFLASAAMAGALYVSGLGWSSASGSVADLILHAGITATVGAVIYGSVLLLLWRLSGMPDGAEHFLLSAGRLSLGRFRRPRQA